MANPDTQLAVVREIEKQIAELEQASDSEVTREEIERLRQQLAALRDRVAGAANDSWERVLLARHPQRPFTLDYIQMLFTELTELHGDRRFGDDQALVGGLAKFEERSVVVM